MHETMVAQNLLEEILTETNKQNAKPVIAKISCGMLNAVNDETLRFAFAVVAKGTACENTKLEIEHKPMQGQCKKCKATFDFELHQPNCPNCKSKEFDLLPDAPLVLEEIEFQSE